MSFPTHPATDTANGSDSPPARVCVCVFMKPPRPGEVKTRLIPLVGAEGAAALAEAFFEDTWEMVQSLPWASPVVASTELSGAGIAFSPRRIWSQGNGDLGARLERILRRGIAEAGAAIALGADSPGLDMRLLNEARERLQNSDAVLGPCSDGGFYLLGLKACPPGLLSGIAWSQLDTFTHTMDRLEEAGLTAAVLDEYFDIDRPEDLTMLRELISAGNIRAPRTARLLQQHAFRESV
jgi:rSAM/selenodomain-associated transferase 1